MISEHDFLDKIFNNYLLMPHRYIKTGPISLARRLDCALEDIDLLAKPYVKQVLQGWGLKIWQGDDGIVRIVSQKAWKYKQRHSVDACSFCGMREKPDALIAARDIHGEIIQNHFVHEQCCRAYTRELGRERYHGR